MICEYGCGQEAKYQFASGKWCCSQWTSQCPAMKIKNSQTLITSETRKCSLPFNKKENCIWCGREITISNLKKHENSCYLNPEHYRECPVCKTPVKRGQTTCSRKCRLEYFGPPNIWDDDKIKLHRTICFRHHEKKCVICDEEHFIDVHHYDKNTENNNPENLVPICILHHKYIHHPRLKYIVMECIIDYVTWFKNKMGL